MSDKSGEPCKIGETKMIDGILCQKVAGDDCDACVISGGICMSRKASGVLIEDGGVECATDENDPLTFTHWAIPEPPQ